MLVGIDQAEEIRYIGAVLPDRLTASEFIHEEGHLFKANKSFNNLIRCILEDDEISGLLNELAKEKEKNDNDVDYKMSRYHWGLLHGDMDKAFVEQYVFQLMRRLTDKNGEYWVPTEGDVLVVDVVQKKQQNWLVSLKENNKELYFRPKNFIEYIEDGDTVQICVSNSWYYRRRLFISGEVALYRK